MQLSMQRRVNDFFLSEHLLNVGFYLGFFEFVPNVRKRGKALLGALIELLVT